MRSRDGDILNQISQGDTVPLQQRCMRELCLCVCINRSTPASSGCDEPSQVHESKRKRVGKGHNQSGRKSMSQSKTARSSSERANSKGRTGENSEMQRRNQDSRPWQEKRKKKWNTSQVWKRQRRQQRNQPLCCDPVLREREKEKTGREINEIRLLESG